MSCIRVCAQRSRACARRRSQIQNDGDVELLGGRVGHGDGRRETLLHHVSTTAALTCVLRLRRMVYSNDARACANAIACVPQEWSAHARSEG